MSLIVHLCGRLVPAEEAQVSVFDRGFLFGDGVYEGLRSSGRKVIGLDRHIARMRSGLSETRIPYGPGLFDIDRLGELTDELLQANGLTDAFIYWQVTRGAPPAGAPLRDRVPPPGMRPTVFGYAIEVKPIADYRGKPPETRRLALRPDTRWARGHVKATALLGSVLAAIEANEIGADDAILVRGDEVAEGTASNVFLASGGRVVTPSLDSAPILAGVTRALILDGDRAIEERPVKVSELLAADEVMVVSTTIMVTAVASIDGRPVGRQPAPGPVAFRLMETLLDAIEKDIGVRDGQGRIEE
jgi:D-alanine transaminase